MWPVVVMQSGDRCWDCDRLARHADEELTASLRRARDLGIIDDDQLSAAVAAIRSRHAR